MSDNADGSRVRGGRTSWDATLGLVGVLVGAAIVYLGTARDTDKKLEYQAEARTDAIERSVEARLLEARRAVYIRFRQEAQNQRNYLRSLTGYSDELARQRGHRGGEYRLSWLAHRELRLAEVNQAMGAAMSELSLYADDEVLAAAREVKTKLHRAETLASAQLESLSPPDAGLVDRIVEVNVSLQACIRAMRNELAGYLPLETA